MKASECSFDGEGKRGVADEESEVTYEETIEDERIDRVQRSRRTARPS